MPAAKFQTKPERAVVGFDLFGGLPAVKYLHMYTEPIPMNWGERKLTEICRKEMGIDPAGGAVFLFFNRKKDQLKMFFMDESGSQEIQKMLPRGGFILPAPEEGKKFLKIPMSKIDTLFRA
jgi:hypothetical protein